MYPLSTRKIAPLPLTLGLKAQHPLQYSSNRRGKKQHIASRSTPQRQTVKAEVEELRFNGPRRGKEVTEIRAVRVGGYRPLAKDPPWRLPSPPPFPSPLESCIPPADLVFTPEARCLGDRELREGASRLCDFLLEGEGSGESSPML